MLPSRSVGILLEVRMWEATPLNLSDPSGYSCEITAPTPKAEASGTGDKDNDKS